VKKSILISVDSLHNGGAEMFAIRLANFLSVECEVYFLEFDSLASVDKNLRAKLNPNIEYFSSSDNSFIKLLYWINRTSNFKCYKIIRRIANNYRYKKIKRFVIDKGITTINSHAIFQNVVLGKIKRALPELKFVLTLHGHYEYYRQEDPLGTSELLNDVIQSCDCLVYTSQEQLETFKKIGFPISKTRKIFYGFEPPDNLSFSRKFDSKLTSLKLLIHSRAVSEKGWEQAILAVDILISKGYDISLTLIGDGPLFQLLREKNLHPNINLVGFIEDVFPFINECDLGLLPSYFFGESLPNTIIEYLYCGKPIIASNIGAIAEMIESEGEYAGELIQVQKGVPVDPFLIVIAIEKYINNHSYYAKKVEIANRAFEKFKMQHCASNYLENF